MKTRITYLIIASICLFAFSLQSFSQITYSTVAAPISYYVKNVNLNKYMSTIGVAQSGNVKCTVKDGTSKGELWIFQLTGNANNAVKIISAQQPTLALSATSTAGYVTLQPVDLATEFTIQPYGANYRIVSTNINTYMNTLNGESALFTYFDGGDANALWQFEDVITAYSTARTSSRALYNITIGGADFGQFPLANRTTFDEVIAIEEAKTASEMTAIELMLGLATINSATAAYTASQNTTLSLLTSTAMVPKWYYIKNNYYPTKVITTNGVVEDGGLKCEVKNTSTDAELWRFELNADNVSVKIINKAQPTLAVKHMSKGVQAQFSAIAGVPDLVISKVSYSFSIGEKGGGQFDYLHCDGSSNLLGWEAAALASKWDFEAYEPSTITNLTATQQLDVLVYGNSQHQIAVQFNTASASTGILTVFNAHGQKILDIQIGTFAKHTTMSMIPGMYLVCLTVNGVIATRKVMVR